jgi:integrase
MAVRPQVRYFESRKAYYCQIRGKQYRLATGPDDFPDGPTYKAAAKRYGEIVCLGSVEVSGDNNSVRVVFESYVSHISRTRRSGTVRVRLNALRPFCDFDGYGDLPVRLLTHHHFYRFQRQMQESPPPRKRAQPGGIMGWGPGKKWSAGMVRTAITCLQAAFNWAAKTGLITKNPLRGLEGPSARSRGREALLGNTAEEIAQTHARILAAARPSFRPFLIVLEATGCRPSDLARATASHFDAQLGALVYHPDHLLLPGETGHKTGSKGKTRTVLLTGEALEIVREAVARHPEGPLFPAGRSRGRSRKSGDWKPRPLTDKAICLRFNVIREKVGMPNLTAYSYRHTFATQWLKAGKPIDALAAILGNTPNVIRKHYAHLMADQAHLRRLLEEFRTPGGGRSGTPEVGGRQPAE